MNFFELQNLHFESEYLLENLCSLRSASEYIKRKNSIDSLAQSNPEFSHFYNTTKHLLEKNQSDFDELNVSIENLHTFCESLKEKLINYAQNFLEINLSQLKDLAHMDELEGYLKHLGIECLGIDDYSYSIESINEVVSAMEYRISLCKNGERRVITMISAIVEDKVESTLTSGHFILKGFKPTSEDNEEMAEFIKNQIINSSFDDKDRSFLENLY